MKCIKCETEMVPAELTGNNIYPVIIKNKRKGLLDIEMKIDVLCYVCPECGYIELYAKEPKRFK